MTSKIARQCSVGNWGVPSWKCATAESKSGCGVGADLSWHGRYVLYGSADGRQAIVDSATRTVTDLVPLSRGLPAESPNERAAVEWASSFGG